MTPLTLDERELLDLLAYAHIQLDKQGVPRTPRPIGADDDDE